jgi:hypothetical protein
VATVLACWLLSLVLPHFQEKMKTLFVVIQILISLILFLSIKKILLDEPQISDLTANLVLIIIVMAHFISLGLVKINITEPYILWNRFGSGTMLKNNDIYPFGDLSHLTSAASCSKSIVIGENLCDPFNRIFNQNPQVIEFMKLANLKNAFVLGIFTSLLFYASIYLINSKHKRLRLQVLVATISPPLVLALDRGNEIITITLINFGVFFILGRKKLYNLGYFLIGISAIFKVWPTFLALYILMFNYRKLSFMTKVVLLTPIIYWSLFYKNLFGMVDSTQYRSPYGLSFGLKHLVNNSLETPILWIYAVLIVISFVYFLNQIKLQSSYSYQSVNLILPFYLTYVSLWISGIHFSYRLVVLIPIFVLLQGYKENTFDAVWVNSIVLTCLITARLSITTALTSIMALVFCIMVLKELNFNRFKSIFSSADLANKLFTRPFFRNNHIASGK